MKQHYTQIIWGMVLVFVNINLGFFDIFPNFIGYGLIAIGLDGLSRNNPAYKKGCVPAVILAAYSFLTMFFPFQVNLQQLSPSNAWLLLLSIIPFVLNLAVFYSICTGIFKDAEAEDNTDLMRRSKATWKFILFITILELLFMPFHLNFKESLMVPSFLVTILLLLGVYLIVDLLRSARNELHRDMNDGMSIS